MRSKDEIEKVRKILWDMANKLADKEVNEACITLTNWAQALDWVLGEKSPLDAFSEET